MRSIPHSEELPVPKPPENLLVMTPLILIKIRDSKKGPILLVI